MTDIRNYTTFDPSKPHCGEEARYVSEDGKDGGGHTTCLWELNADGSCPNALVHHRAWIDSGLSQDDWAASILAVRKGWGAIQGIRPHCEFC